MNRPAGYKCPKKFSMRKNVKMLNLPRKINLLLTCAQQKTMIFGQNMM